MRKPKSKLPEFRARVEELLEQGFTTKELVTMVEEWALLWQLGHSLKKDQG